MTVEKLNTAEEKTGYDIQNDVYTWFLKKGGKYKVAFQDIDQTNALPCTAGITYSNIVNKQKADLCKILGVDAVISGKIVTSKPMSEGGAIVMTVLVGFGGTTNKTTAKLKIHDQNNTLLWKFDDDKKARCVAILKS